jgi:hypothetical protein
VIANGYDIEAGGETNLQGIKPGVCYAIVDLAEVTHYDEDKNFQGTERLVLLQSQRGKFNNTESEADDEGFWQGAWSHKSKEWTDE